MRPLDSKPKRRQTLALAKQGKEVLLYDSLRIATTPISVTEWEIEILNGFTGELTLAEILTQSNAKGFDISEEKLIQLVETLDVSLYLESPALHRYLSGPVRRPSCIGCYPEEPISIHTTLNRLYEMPGGPGLPQKPGQSQSDRKLRAVLVPHMDFERGGVTYGWGYKELAENTDARLFVIIATSHYSRERFSLTRMDFETPLGTVPTDQSYIDRIVQHYGNGLFNDPYAHLPEHSVELEVVMLQHLFPEPNAFRIVPLVVGSFHDSILTGQPPSDFEDIDRMIRALHLAEAESKEKLCYIISGDLAHIGPKFRDPKPVSQAQLQHSKQRDDQLLSSLVAANVNSYWETICEEGDSRRICGLPPTYVTLQVAKPKAGKMLYYGRYVHPTGYESVSFASMAFYD